MRDEEIISELKQGRTSASLEQIYKQFPVIRKMIVSNGGNEEEAKDVFQDSVIIFYRMCQKPDFTLSSSISTLVYAISKKRWLKKLRDHYSRIKEVKGPELLTSEEDVMNEEEDQLEKIKVMENVLLELGDPCRELLSKFYYERTSMKEIAIQMNYSSEKTAKAQKYKCLERAKKMAIKFKSSFISFQQ